MPEEGWREVASDDGPDGELAAAAQGKADDDEEWMGRKIASVAWALASARRRRTFRTKVGGSDKDGVSCEHARSTLGPLRVAAALAGPCTRACAPSLSRVLG